MEMEEVPGALHARLGLAATMGLLQLLDRSQQEAREHVISTCLERFDRRLVEETSSLRVQIAEVDATLRQEMTSLGASLRQEMTNLGASLRLEMATSEGTLRGDIASGRVEFIKWAFMFWVGQVLAMTGIMGVMLRLMR